MRAESKKENANIYPQKCGQTGHRALSPAKLGSDFLPVSFEGAFPD